VAVGDSWKSQRSRRKRTNLKSRDVVENKLEKRAWRGSVCGAKEIKSSWDACKSQKRRGPLPCITKERERQNW